MFRVKLNPQAAISIQNAIPRLVITLILITFSYAIAGLLIDLTYVLSSILVAIINPTIFPVWLKDIITTLNQRLGLNIPVPTMNESQNLLSFLFLFLGKGSEAAKIISEILNPAAVIAEIAGTPGYITEIVGVLTSFNMGFGSIIFGLILSIILLFTFFKIFLSLLRAYVSVIISIIFGPLQIMIGALPAQNFTGGWVKNLIANLAIFPTTITMMALTVKIIEVSESGSLWVPPPLQIPLPSRIISAMIAYGLLLLMPKAADMVKEAMQAKTFPYGTAIGEALGPLKTPTRMLALYPIQYGTQSINDTYQKYMKSGGQAPLWVARGKALTDVLKTLGIIK
jgi:hypothetical protein